MHVKTDPLLNKLIKKAIGNNLFRTHFLKHLPHQQKFRTVAKTSIKSKFYIRQRYEPFLEYHVYRKSEHSVCILGVPSLQGWIFHNKA